MQFLKRLFNFYINASLHVALAVYSLVRITELYFELQHHKALGFFIFFGTISGYNYIKYAGIAKWHHRSLTDGLKVIQLFSGFCFLATVYFASFLSVEILVAFSPFLLLTLLYEIPFLRKKKINLRNVGALKIVLISLVWAGITVLLPLMAAGNSLETSVLLFFLQRFLWIVVLIIPFDIRDIQFDEANLKTIPQILGIKNAKKLGFVLLLITFVLEFSLWSDPLFKNVFLGVTFLLLFLLMRTKTTQSKYYSSFWIEAVPIFWWLLLLGILKFQAVYY
jgi:4-hydroxybenzoate polyprenyltransferase